MEDTYEKKFIRSFIRKNRQERLLYELNTPAKRYAGISRFAHQAEQLLNPAKIMVSTDDPECRKETDQFIQSHDELCYVLSCDPCINEMILPTAEAFLKASAITDAAIIMRSTFAIVLEEPMKGGRRQYLLSEEA